MKIYPFEILDATNWSQLNTFNYLPRVIKTARGDDANRLANIIKKINSVNSDTVSSIGKKIGVYLTRDLKVWWDIKDSEKLGISIKYDKKLAAERLLPRSGFTILGLNENGPHRKEGPALIHKDGTEYYYNNGTLHREEGPAIVFPSGSEQWYINGEQLSEDQIEIHKLYLLGLDNIDIDVLELLDLI